MWFHRRFYLCPTIIYFRLRGMSMANVHDVASLPQRLIRLLGLGQRRGVTLSQHGEGLKMAVRRVGLWAALAVVIALAVVLSGWAALRPAKPPPSGAASPPSSGAGQRLFAGLPARIAAGPNTPDLPADLGVGRAAFIYTTDEPGFPIYVVAVDGTPYRVGVMPKQPAPANVTLSPDGRWLIRQRGDRWIVRDLTSQVEHSVDGQQVPEAWSVDGRSLLWHEAAPPGQRGYHVMDTASGRMTKVAFTGPIEQTPVIMLNDHEIAAVDYISFSRNETRFSVDIVDVRDGTRLRSTPVDLSAHLRPGERTVAYVIPLLYASGSPTRLWTAVGVQAATPTPEVAPNMPVGVIGVDLASGRILTRLDWSPPARGEGTQLVGAVADGAVLARLTNEGTEISIVSETGERRVVTRLPVSSSVYPAGCSF